MDEVDKYLLQKELDLKNYSNDNPLFIKQYEYAQLLCAVGKHKDSLKFYAESFADATKWKNNTLYNNHYCLIGTSYALACEYLGDIAKAEEVYNAIMAHNPVGAHIGDYALFLHRKKREYDKAEAFYTKAIELYPDHSSILLKYAGFLRHVKRDIEQSEVFYLKSIDANPENADALGSYASFLHGVYNKTTEAEEYYVKAMKYDDLHTNNLCNYGLFLSEERGNYTQAEIYYKRSLQVNPNHSNTLYNYAVMLDTHLKRKSEAETLYRKTIAIETRHSYALYNLAVLLEERQFILNNEAKLRHKERQEDPNDVSGFVALPTTEEEKKLKMEIASFYKRAVDADPRDATTLADYGRYLLIRLEEPAKAEAALQGALKLDPDCEIAVYNMAILLHKHKGNYDAAVSMLRNLVQKNPKHAAGHLQLARIMSAHYQTEHINRKEDCSAIVSKMIADLLEESLEFYEKAVALTSEVDAVLSEYMKFSAKYGNNRQKLHTISFVNSIFKTKVKSEDNKTGTTSAQDPHVTNAIALLEHLSASAK